MILVVELQQPNGNIERAACQSKENRRELRSSAVQSEHCPTALTTGPFGFALFDKCLHAFLLIFSGEGEVKQAPFEVQAFAE